MSLLFAFVVFGGWFFLAVLVAVLVGMVLGFNPDNPPLLVRFADDRDRGRLLAARLTEDRQVAELDAMYEAPAREPRRFGGWRS